MHSVNLRHRMRNCQPALATRTATKDMAVHASHCAFEKGCQVTNRLHSTISQFRDNFTDIKRFMSVLRCLIRRQAVNSK